ncbi:family 43 glycosylhydrolase [Coraliomargarita sp. SDUM461004]|uniref:Family 43 glycosylhydrolase n=2 Tax=Thalassobacterium sedimentorum TaxID=3041258 RepID=A0ABU1ALE9_9BACT|nr:family 43 glycosylhydrolase [Coraliomargarita sp. SDUM461004]MDQ8195626.1 family 43 glycosylhydrolase [Coraliomargarita sp. SDUM461004]
MKYTKHILVLLLAGVGSLMADPQRRSNPIVSHMFTADPSAHVWEDGRLYVYPSTDTSSPAGYATMDGYHVFSTDDLITWVDHGEILHSDDVPWGRERGGYMWAPDCAYKDGTYYFYFPHPSGNDHRKTWKIGVATSQNPASGFEVQGYIEGLTPQIDPCVFIDDDGQAYLYHGGPAPVYAGKLKDNMMEIEGAMVAQEGLHDLREGPYVFKRNAIYYLIYPDNSSGGHRMNYAMSEHPLGPWESKGVLLDETSVLTTHGSCVEYKGQWYLFYHSGALSGGIEHNRSICFDPIFFNEDGTIRKVEQSRGVPLPTFHRDIHFNRMLGMLDLGAYTTADLAKQGIENDAISSLEVAPGTVVECFEEDNFLGNVWRFENDCIDLSVLGCDNAISSIKVTRSGPSDNLVINGSFEQGVEQTISWWQGRHISHLNRSLEDPADGYYALWYQADKAMRPLTQSIALEPHKRYHLSAWMKLSPDSEGQVIVDALEPFNENCKLALSADAQGGEWVQLSTDFNSGENRKITLQISTSKDFSGRCFWDQLVLAEE